MSTSDTERHPAVPPDLARKLVLTYDNTANTDGVGAQLQRIYGTYSIARLLGANYLHSPLTRVDYQGLSALERNAGEAGFHHEFNALFQIKSDVRPTDGFFKTRLPNISIATVNELNDLFDQHETGGKRILAQLAVPYGIADMFPDCYEVCKDISPFEASARAGRALRVALHVRRGELLVLDSERMLPNSYYINAAGRIADILDEIRCDYQIELWTEATETAFTVQPDHHGISHRISTPMVLDPEATRLEEFRFMPNLLYRLNGKAIDCIRQLATADILVMSRSSFSYLAGILNKRGIVLYHPFWHSAPSSWIHVHQDGNFDRRAFERLLIGSEPRA
jgi:hypothetical protein